MAVRAEFRDYLEDLFAPVGGVSQRRMFGGLGIFRDGPMIALVDDEVLYFKADETTVPQFEAEGSAPLPGGYLFFARSAAWWAASAQSRNASVSSNRKSGAFQ